MAVTIDDVLTPLPADGSAIRNDLIYLGPLLGLPISATPGDPTYQIADWLGRWFTWAWNKYGLPALAAQFGEKAVGDWLTLWARARGINRPLATFAGGPVTVENRSGVFVDVSAVGAMQIANAAGYTFTSQGPAPGSTGTMGAAAGTTYLQTVLVFQADVAGTGSNTAAASLAGYPSAPADAPPGVYVATSSSTPAAPNPALLGSNQMADGPLLALVRAAQALAANPGSPVGKFKAVVLLTTFGTPPAPVATNRVQIVGTGGALTLYCATPSGPTPGSASDPTTELGAINARVQYLCGIPGLTITTAAAAPLTINLGTVTLYVTAESNVSAANATATAIAALDLWSSQVLEVGGRVLSGGGAGFVLLAEVEKILQSRVNLAYPKQWLPGIYYAAGDQVSNVGQTFVATAAGTSAGLMGPTGDGGPDGGSGLVWADTTQVGGGAQFDAAPGVYDVAISGMSGDVACPVGNVAVFTYGAIAVQVVAQGT